MVDGEEAAGRWTGSAALVCYRIVRKERSLDACALAWSALVFLARVRASEEERARDENGMYIFRSYSRSNSFRKIQICSYPSLNIQHLISYPYPNT